MPCAPFPHQRHHHHDTVGPKLVCCGLPSCRPRALSVGVWSAPRHPRPTTNRHSLERVPGGGTAYCLPHAPSYSARLFTNNELHAVRQRLRGREATCLHLAGSHHMIYLEGMQTAQQPGDKWTNALLRARQEATEAASRKIHSKYNTTGTAPPAAARLPLPNICLSRMATVRRRKERNSPFKGFGRRTHMPPPRPACLPHAAVSASASPPSTTMPNVMELAA